MATKKKVKKNNTVTIITAVLIVFLLVLCGIRVFFNDKVVIEPRVNNIATYQAEHSKYKVAAWVKIPGTDIDYPVLDDVESVTIEDSENMDYLWKNGELTKLNKINYIMGHNIMNLSRTPKITDEKHVRFEQLMSFTYLDFAKENQYIQFTIDGKDYLFKIFSVSYPGFYDVDSYNGDDIETYEVKEFVEKSLRRSIYSYDVDVNENDTILSLITCTRMFSFERDFVVDARLVREDESTGKYNVEKSNKYQEVEKIMKGAEQENEEV